jgi:hypothetical protein
MILTAASGATALVLSACSTEETTNASDVAVGTESQEIDILELGPPEGYADSHPVLWPDDRSFDARDLNGIWTRGNPEGGLAGKLSCIQGWSHTGPCGDRGFSLEWPEFTPEGQAALDANKPSYGVPVGTEAADARTELHIGRRRGHPGQDSNDPQKTCNPIGVTRALIYPAENQFVFLEDRILQHFSFMNAWRTIWMDGRKLPSPDEVNQLLWYGYSIGRWEGDTLVVETVGQDDRIWIDHFGYPISDEAHLEERYTRSSHSVLELEMTITDPKYYAVPWKGQKKKFLLRPKDYFLNSTWAGMYYDDCATLDEVDVFQSLIVNGG